MQTEHFLRLVRDAEDASPRQPMPSPVQLDDLLSEIAQSTLLIQALQDANVATESQGRAAVLKMYREYLRHPITDQQLDATLDWFLCGGPHPSQAFRGRCANG